MTFFMLSLLCVALVVSGWLISLLIRLRDLWSWIHFERVSIAFFLGASVNAGIVWLFGSTHPYALLGSAAFTVMLVLSLLLLYQRPWAFSLREVMPPCDAGTPPMRAVFALLALLIIALYLFRLSMVLFPTMELTGAFSILSHYFWLSWSASPLWIGALLIAGWLLLAGGILRETRSRSLALFALILTLIMASLQSQLAPQISLLVGLYWAFCIYALARSLRGECDRVSTSVYFLALALCSYELYFVMILSLPVILFTIARHSRIGSFFITPYGLSALIPSTLLATFLSLYFGEVSYRLVDLWSLFPVLLFATIHEVFHTLRQRGIFQGKWYL